MSLFECIGMSVQAVIANKTRSLLTVLGVIIGVAAVIALVSLGQGTQNSIMSSIASLGTNVVLVETRGYARFELEDIEMLLDRVPTLSDGSALYPAGVVIKAGSLSKGIELWGVAENFLGIMTYELDDGRFFDGNELAGRHKVVVLGAQVHRDLFGDDGGVGDTVRLNGESFEVIGIAKPKGAVMGQNYDNKVFVPHSTAQRLLRTKYTNVAIFKATDAKSASLAGDHIARILEEKFRNTNRQLEQKWGTRIEPFRVYCQDEMQESLSKVTGTLTLFLASIAGVSLLVSGIGIMNIMLVSVTERTREIGIRKSIGAKKSQLLLQFLLEALILSSGGGLVGLALGSQAARLVGKMGNIAVLISPASAAVAFGFATMVGVFFGIYPALRAANMDPIVALRHQ